MPNYIADYVYDLCCLANTFYQNNRLSDLKDEEMKNEWILLLSLTNKILKKMLHLLTIEIPSIM
jgi:arginyl-tRNA synthetase